MRRSTRNAFTLIDGAGNQNRITTADKKLGPYVDVVIADLLERKSRVYYANDYNPTAGAYAPPECFSDNGVGPSRQASVPQSPTCSDCPMSVWGSETSRVSGKGIPACSEQQKIAILVPGYDQLFLLRVPPNSLKNFRAYAEQFRGRPFDMDSVVTRISFVSQGTLKFEPTGWADEISIQAVDTIAANKAADGMLGRGDLPKEGVALPANRPSAQIEHQPAQVPQGSVGGFQPAPFVHPGQTKEPPAETSPAATAPVGTTTAATNPPARRRGRPPAAETQPTGSAGVTTAPFRPAPVVDAGQAASPAQTAPTTFGFQAPQAAPADIQKNLDSLFGPKT